MNSLPPIDVDCSEWDCDIPENLWSTGKFETPHRAVSAIDVDLMPAPIVREVAQSNTEIETMSTPQLLSLLNLEHGLTADDLAQIQQLLKLRLQELEDKVKQMPVASVDPMIRRLFL